MSHYYINDDHLASEPHTIYYDFKGQHLTFTTDNGVFSKERIDYGSRVLIATIETQGAKTLLDIGCGYGAMGICLKATNPELEVTMTDINKRAISLANKNIKCNNLQRIRAYESDLFKAIDDKYDIIISNPPIRAGKKVVSAIISESYDHLQENGRLVIVIQKKQGAPSAKKLMKEIFGQATILKRDKGYYILQSYK